MSVCREGVARKNSMRYDPTALITALSDGSVPQAGEGDGGGGGGCF
jgi:hypothetical protein